MKCLFVFIILLLCLFVGVFGVQVIELLLFKDYVQELCFQYFIVELCCLMCQNEILVDFNVLIVCDLCYQVFVLM